VGFFLESLLAAHDHSTVEVFCYSDVVREDPATQRLRQHTPHWRAIAGKPDEAVADLIRADRIDVLVDLAGHTARNRLTVFARKPAPVQVTYLGYCDTTGLAAMDYRLTDALADPPGATEHLHSERLVRLPDTAWCFCPPEDSPPAGIPPMVHSGHVTFACFNVRSKITDETLATWSGLLARVPRSRLLLKDLSYREASVQQRVRAVFENAGIAPERVEFATRVPTRAEHLRHYERVDIALDTFPYNGTTTTCESLWMGVPVISLAGHTHASRVGVSLLTNAGLPGFIAANPDEYIRLAAQLTTDASQLAAIRTSIRDRMAASPLTDAPRFAQAVEQAFREMWRTRCAAPGAG